jgi:NTE family protein
VAADIQNGEKVVFSTGSIAEAMRSSMSIPGIFRPYETGGRHLVDGGVVDNLPVDVAKGMGADIIIAVESRGQNPRSVDSLKSSFQITAQTMNLFIQNNMKEARKDADLLIKPDLSGYNTASYADAKRLIELGAAGAEAARPLLEALAARIAKERPLVKPEDQANRRAYHAPPTLIDMRIEGSTQEMRAQARAAFAPLLGRTLDRGALQRAIDSVYAIGQCSLVKFDLEAASGGEGAMGILTLVPDTTAENAFLLSTKFRALFTTIDENKTESLPALVLRDLSGKDSALFAEVGFQDRKRFYAEYFQPFGPFFVMPFFKYESVFDAYQFSRSQLYWTRYQSLGGGGWMGLTFSKASDFLVGYSFSNESAYDFGDTAPKVQLATLSGAFRLDTREGSVFPASGLSLLLHGRWADPRLGGASTFTQSDLEFTGAIPLGKNLTFGVAGFAGTDFAGILPVKGGLSSERYYTVKHPGMFYGMEERPSAATGDNVAALGLELRAKVGRVNALFGGDVIVLANFSLAGVQRAAKYAGDPTAFDFLPLSWNAAAGLGLRITPHFGLLLEGGVVDDGNPTIGPRRLAVSIELGSFSEFFEDQR